ncbi:EsaB/YukD family protein [Burkholderia aenigmatica]|uniref:EsaB/YukD family protein n=1 Tax=Burkholderia aenigmatica TaxID=2015348 RepID=UPI001F1B210B|nr:EsaB/YukD family protein [Burkholderia aenigmatica]UKD15540.1 EsaB/YukD family protein [Burkholderia aenigmatica]
MRRQVAAIAVMVLLSGCKTHTAVSTHPFSGCVSGPAIPACTAPSSVATYGMRGPSAVPPASAAERQYDAAADGYKTIDARFDAWRNACAAAMSAPELNPIRDKIEIFHDPSTPTPYTYAALDLFPARADLPLIAKWIALRDACVKHEHEIDLTSPALTPMAQSMVLQRAEFNGIAEAKIRRLAIGLSQRKLTYGEFAQRRYQINSAAENAAQRVAATLSARDPGSQFLEQRRIERRFSAEVDTFERYLHSVDARQPGTVRLVPGAAIGSDAAEQACGTNCSSDPMPDGAPLKQLRHGFTVSHGGLGATTERRVDFDSGKLSVIDFDLQSIEGKTQSAITRRSDIVLATGDLAKLRAIADMIWRSFGPVPTARAALGTFWAIRVVNGRVVRSERGLGDVGGAGRDLEAVLQGIEERQLAHFLFENRRMYQVWSCYDYPSAGHTSVPGSHIRTSGYGWSDPADVPLVFPIPSTDPLPFRFDVERIQWTCAD